MKNFTYLLLLATLASLPLYAQVSIGLRGGYTAADLRYKDPTIGYKYNGIGNPTRLSSWHADLLFDIPVSGMLYLQPVIRYNTKGAHFEQQSAMPAGVYLPSANEIRLHYLELPLNVVYKIPFGFGKVALGAGPYVAYCLSGKYDVAIRYNGEVVQSAQQNISFSARANNIIATNSQLRRWDAGANFMLGFEFNNLLTVGANYGLGLTDFDKSASSLKNSYLGISLGFLLNREDY